jgi:hypothetical protein
MIRVVRRLLQIALAAWLGLTMSWAQAWASPAGGAYTPVSGGVAETTGYTKDTGRSEALTAYLKSHRLPLVGAQVLNDSASGQRTVVLYGFVATDFGKSDATTKARAFLHDSSAVVKNRVMVNPAIASQPAASHPHQEASGETSPASPDASIGAGNSANADDGSAAMGGAQSYLEQQSQQAQIQQYQNQQNPLAGGGAPGGMTGGISGGMVPLVALLGLLSATNGGSSFSFGSSGPAGLPNSFGGGSPYRQNPYGGGSPYGYPPGAFPSSPYGSPYGSPPGSFSPYP